MPNDPIFDLLIQTMPENCGIFLMGIGTKIGCQKFRAEHLIELGQDPNLMHIIAMVQRPGAEYFAIYLEHKFFSPNNQKLNDCYEVRHFKWRGQLWTIISIPATYKDAVYKAAEAARMKISDGIPMVIGDDPLVINFALRPALVPEDQREGLHVFPLACERAFTLENEKDYRPDWETEKAQIDALYREVGIVEEDVA